MLSVQKIKNILKERIPKERYLHMISTAVTAKDIAITNKYKKPEDAYIAGLLHDVVREDEPLESLEKVEELGIKDDAINERTAHAFLGAHIAESEFGITDTDILFAIKYHDSVLSDKATKLYKIVYLADKMEPLRKWHNPKFIESAKKNIDDGFKELLQYNVSYAIDKFGSLNQEMKDAVKFYKLKK
jgi:predicted HD superfamily hydrolase involved in NAD metabolism